MLSQKKLSRNILFRILPSMLLFVINLNSFGSSELGYWKTIDDKTGDDKSIVLLEQNSIGEVTAKVIKILKTDDGSDPETRACDKCTGLRKNQRIKGMTVMWGLKKTADNLWSDGEILDPKSGSIYNVKFSLDESKTKLNVRGFLGYPLFGRTQVWHKLASYSES